MPIQPIPILSYLSHLLFHKKSHCPHHWPTVSYDFKCPSDFQTSKPCSLRLALRASVLMEDFCLAGSNSQMIMDDIQNIRWSNTNTPCQRTQRIRQLNMAKSINSPVTKRCSKDIDPCTSSSVKELHLLQCNMTAFSIGLPVPLLLLGFQACNQLLIHPIVAGWDGGFAQMKSHISHKVPWH